MRVKGGTVAEHLLHVENQGIVGVQDVEGQAAGFRPGQGQVIGPMGAHGVRLGLGQADQMALQADHGWTSRTIFLRKITRGLDRNDLIFRRKIAGHSSSIVPGGFEVQS